MVAERQECERIAETSALVGNLRHEGCPSGPGQGIRDQALICRHRERDQPCVNVLENTLPPQFVNTKLFAF